jgi:hypothetical protein
MSISSFFNNLWKPACGEQDLLAQSHTTYQPTSGENTTLQPSTMAQNPTSSTSVQKPRGASKQVIDLEYSSPASSERFQYQSQSEKQELVHVEYASPDPSEFFQYRAQLEKRIDTKYTSPYTSDQPQIDTQSQCPCGLFQDEDHWKKKDWAAAVTIGAVGVICLVLLAGASGGSGSSFAGSGSNMRHDPEHDARMVECVDSCCINGCCVPSFGMCGIDCPLAGKADRAEARVKGQGDRLPLEKKLCIVYPVVAHESVGLRVTRGAESVL